MFDLFVSCRHAATLVLIGESLGKDPARLKSVLAYHVVPAKLTADHVKNGKMKTVEGADVDLSRAGQFLTVEDLLAPKPDGEYQFFLALDGVEDPHNLGALLRTADGKERVLGPRQYGGDLLKDKAVVFTDLRVGTNVNLAYVQQGDRYIVSTVTFVEDAAPPPPQATVIEGEVIRVVGQDQVILRAAGNKEVIVFVDPKTTYLFEEKPGKFVDIRPGANISVNYNVLDRRNVAVKIVGPVRRR